MSNAINQMNNEFKYSIIAQITREAAAMTNAELFARANELNKLFNRMDNDQMLSLEFDIIMDEKIRRQFGK
jgi:hypothetical protein